MMKHHLLLLISFLLFIQCKKKSIEAEYLIEDINILNVKTGQIEPHQYIAITDQIISGIFSKPISTNPSCQKIKASGQYIIPGLWDMHTHYSWNHNISNPLLIANGVTGIREMWGTLPVINDIKTKIEIDNFTAPNIYSAGNIIDGPKPIWPGSAAIESPEDVDKELTDQAKAGADFFKVYSLLSPASYQAIATKSKELQIPFAGHIPGSVSIWDAIKAGQQSFEHLYGVLEACTQDQEKLDSLSKGDYFGAGKMKYMVDGFDHEIFDSLSLSIAESESWVCPTLVVLHNIANLDDTTMMDDPRMAYTPVFMKRMWNPKNDFRFATRGPDFYEANQYQYEFQKSLLGQFARDGVKILAGTDYSNPYCYPGFSLHDELALLVESGLSTLQALQAATINPAVFMKKTDDFGTIEIGKKASLVLLKENPLIDINHTKKIDGVFLRGKYFSQEGIQSLLDTGRQLAEEMGT